MEVPRGSKITKKTVYYYFIRGPKGGYPPGGSKRGYLVPRGVTQGEVPRRGVPPKYGDGKPLGVLLGGILYTKGDLVPRGVPPGGSKRGVSTLYTVPKNRVLSSH